MKYLLLLILSVNCFSLVAKDFYKCTDNNGRQTFSDKPCKANQKKEIYEVKQQSSSTNSNSSFAKQASGMIQSNGHQFVIRDAASTWSAYRRELTIALYPFELNDNEKSNILSGAWYPARVSRKATNGDALFPLVFKLQFHALAKINNLTQEKLSSYRFDANSVKHFPSSPGLSSAENKNSIKVLRTLVDKEKWSIKFELIGKYLLVNWDVKVNIPIIEI